MEVVSKILPSVSDLSTSVLGPSPTTALGSSPTPHPPPPAHSPSPAVAVPTESVREKKFNIIAYGIEESSKGTLRSIRKQEDIKKVEVIILSVSPNVSSNNIRDCTRLGKYNPHKPKTPSYFNKFSQSPHIPGSLKIKPPVQTKSLQES